MRPFKKQMPIMLLTPHRSYKRTRSYWRRIWGVNYRGGRRNRYRDNQSVAAHLAIHRKSHPSLISLLDQRGKTRFHNVGDVSASRIDRSKFTDYAIETNFIAWNCVKIYVILLFFLLLFQYHRQIRSYSKTNSSILSKLDNFFSILKKCL